VLVCCWSSKGGSGTTVIAAALTVLLGRRSPAGALAVDLAGDLPVVLGLADDPDTAGVCEWLDGGALVPADGLARLERRVSPDVALVPRGRGSPSAARAPALAGLLAADGRPVVVDAGVVDDAASAAVAFAARADHSLLVVRPCFLALRRALHAPLRPTGVVVIVEDGRAIDALDVEEALGVPVRAEVHVTPQVARAVDAGLFAHRLPRSLERELARAA